MNVTICDANTTLLVTITLTPLGHDEKENHRVIKMNKEKKEVEIGRASRNAYKGILAAHDNAWFDYPILSRAHAKFTIGLSSRVSIHYALASPNIKSI